MRSVPVPAAQQVEAAAMVASDAAACPHIVFDNYHYTTGTEGSSGAAPVFYVNRQTDHAVLVHDEQEFAETLASLAANPHHYGEVQTVAADTDQVQHVNWESEYVNCFDLFFLSVNKHVFFIMKIMEIRSKAFFYVYEFIWKYRVSQNIRLVDSKK